MARLLALLAAAALLVSAASASTASPPILTDQLCDVCTWAWTSAQDVLAKPENQKALMHLIEDDACGILPSAQASACKDAAREYVPPAIAALLSFDAPEACGSAGLCPPSGNGALPRPSPRLVAAVAAATAPASSPSFRGVPCPMCRLAVNNVKLQLEDPENQAAVLAKARAVCAAMPPEVSPQCNDFVSANAPKVFAIADDIDPNKLCDIVGACPPNGLGEEEATTTPTSISALVREEARQQKELSPSVSDPSSTCDTCKALLAQAAAAVNDPATQRQVLAYAAKLCGSLRTMADACVSDVQSYGPVAFETVQQYLTPDTCATVGLCPSSGGGAAVWRHPGEVLVRPGVETA